MAEEQNPNFKQIKTDIQNVTKRDGTLAPFDETKIYNAILKAGTSTGEFGESDAWLLTAQVMKVINHKFSESLPSIEQIQDIVEYDCKTQLYNDTFSTYTKDMQTANINIAINYSLDASGVVDLHRKIGTLYEQKVLYPAISAGIKDIIGKWDAASLVENRDVASKQILDNLVEELNGKHIILESVSIRNIDYSDTFERSIEAKVVAKQKAEEAKNRTVEVQEEAKQKVLSAEAEAKSMQIRAEALNQNKNLVSYEAVQKWDGKLPVNIYGAAPIPFININKD